MNKCLRNIGMVFAGIVLLVPMLFFIMILAICGNNDKYSSNWR